MSKTDLNNNTVEWNKLNWRKIQKKVFKLQKRIYRAYINGDVRKGRRLQKTLIKSYYNRLLAVRKVTQDNQGKATAGVDKIKSLTPKQRFELADNLTLGDKSKPIKRVWIPKPGKKEKRPLGIPVMHDRAVQALAKSALEPEWEAKFEGNSFGFRPGRSAHDAIEAIFNHIRYKPKYVIDTDISKCFDKINHQKLLSKLETFPKLRKQIRAWLKAEIVDYVKCEKTPNQQGTPQGGVLSPLLSNIALHGLENRIKQTRGLREAAVIRYADDFVVLHYDIKKIRKCQTIISDWLKEYDLELNTEKTQIVHTLNELEDKKPGFNFLGFNVRQYKAGKCNSGKNTVGKILGFKTIIKPSNESVKRHFQEISETIDRLKPATQKVLINQLNPIIKGWCNYFRTVCSKETFGDVYNIIHPKLRRWADWRHPNKSKQWASDKYWKTIGNDNWVFTTSDEGKDMLHKHYKTPIIRHTKVKNIESPYNGDTLYWGERMSNHPELKKSLAEPLRKQEGRCNWCGLTFQEEDRLEKDHILPVKAGGKNTKDNLQLLHKHCHDEKTKNDLKLIKRYKSQKEWNKILTQFNKTDWEWIDDNPTLV